jgi:transposase InsO family protein
MCEVYFGDKWNITAVEYRFTRRRAGNATAKIHRINSAAPRRTSASLGGSKPQISLPSKGNNNRGYDSKTRAHKAITNDVTNTPKQKSSSQKSSSSNSNKSKEPKENVLMINVTSENSKVQDEILLDSGASNHMSPQRHWLHDLRPISPREIRLGDNSTVTAEAAGNIILCLPYHGGATLKLLIKDVLYVSELGLSLLSCARLASRGVTCMFDDTGCTLIDKNDNDDILARAIMRENLYWIQNAHPETIPENAHTTSTGPNTGDLTVWHNRLAHVSKDKIASMLRAKQLQPATTPAKGDICTDCSIGKQTRDTFKGHLDKASKPGDVSHSDVVGPLSEFHSGARYFVSFIDEWTRFVTVTPIKRKSLVLQCFKEFKTMFETRDETTIKSIHSDNGGKYTPVERYAKSKGIAVTRSAPYAPQSNGIAERMNRTLMEAGSHNISAIRT